MFKLFGHAPRIDIPHYLLRLIFATLLPLIVFAVVAGALLVRHERDTFERGAQERVRALSSAVDAELRGAITTLQAVAQSSDLREDDLRRFHATASRVKEAQQGWLTVNVAEPVSGRQLLNVLRPYGTDLATVPESASLEAVRATGQPAIGDLVTGPLTNRVDFAVRVPVFVDGRLRYVLSAVIDPALIQNLIVEQRFPSSWTGTVVDRQHKIVARSVDPEGTGGMQASKPLREMLLRGREGTGAGKTLEGVDVTTSYFTSPLTGWSVAVGAPRSVLNAAAHLAAWQLMGGAVLALLTAVLVARRLGRRIAEPIGALAERARRLAVGGGRGEPVELRAPAIEITHLANAVEQAIAAVRERESMQDELSAVTANASVALFKLDVHGHCLYMNPAAEAMIGYGLAEVRGAPLHDLIHRARPDGMPYPFEACPIADAVQADRRLSGEDVFVHRSGRFVPVAFTASPIHYDGAVAGLIVEVRDIGDEKRAEAERVVLLAREQQLRADAESANRSKDEFLAMLGHELRNPLGAISNASNVIRRAPGSEPAARAEKVIGRQVTLLTRLVDDLLDAGRVSSGKLVLSRTPIDLADLVRRCVAMAQREGKAATHRIDSELASVWVDGDETRLEQVVTNLLGNALRYTPPGGRIGVRLAAAANQAQLVITDDGCGIAPELLPRVFDLFVQGSRGLERSQGGLGIGLTLVQRLIELHGGEVTAQSAGEGRGSTFTVRLPRIEAPAVNRAGVPHAGADASAICKPRRVLIVEDNSDVRATLRDALELAGHVVHEFADGRSAADAARRLRPDVALIDLGLPGMSGYAVAERLRADASFSDMLLVALTGYGLPEDRARSLAAGFDLHATKPIDMTQLLATIERWPSATPGSAALSRVDRKAP